MEPINIVTSVLSPLDRINVDTDQIIPKQFLKRIERTGFGKYLFYGWRFKEDGTENPSFVLNNPIFKGSTILVANDNFGCGSSREHAPWALMDFGFKVIIAPSFADIFYNNCVKNGVLPVRLSEKAVEQLLNAGKNEAYELTVHLEEQIVKGQKGESYSFDIDPYWKQMLLNGWDEIALTIQYDQYIEAYEKSST
ncbi:3-isopropylmalate dehydratase small subunit [Jeotgalibacillus soli]|uniref:3-isopropylmalate dehydratase small subunit n=1 Tax=Jeotgalibacillus soli TaxID=889306 RepID=A0A0C2VJU0_9BACL|nr:3-isopropylmalate dehydratase small subunit [Jeotgalibacillus soli]KIL44746.1 isopropylmalate isomerase [Jeotgalibacillus soli]